MARVRDRQIIFRVTEAEKKMIIARRKECDYISQEKYLRDMALQGYVVNVDYRELKELIYQMQKIGNNINQIAHHANAYGVLFQQDLEVIKMEMKHIWQLLRLNLLNQR